MKRNRVLVLIISLFTVLGLQAQVNVEEKLDSLRMLVGEQTDLHLFVTTTKGMAVQLPSYKSGQQLVPGIEVVDQRDEDTTEVADGKIRFGRTYTLTSFDEKVYAIPALSVKAGGKTFAGQPQALKVLTIPVDTTHADRFYPPKDVQDNPFLWSEWSGIFWLSVLVLLLCGAFLFLLVRLKQHKPIVIHIRTVKRVPAHERALHEIEAIKAHHTETQEGQKEYYTKLTDTLREYIQQRFGFRAMEMTSSEIISRLQESGDEKMIAELRDLFTTADLVKFAKYETLINENDANLVNAVKFIDETKTDEVTKEERVAPVLSADDEKSRHERRLIKGLLWLSGILAVVLLAVVFYELYMILS
ncbi:MAG: BatD family protein [Prevotella sp.]|uniref:BatD family protein n=1 Tax=Prevotella sp. AGR2160 TaxID=1280674 RepID=UPI000413BAF6|nr:BatD family protein [Prevotella sp. AGR2160]MDD5861854.1 BatD family protein [Prevotella sp.]